MKYKELVTGIADCSAVTVGGKKYAGSYLAMIVALNPNLLTKEAAETPQLISELGRLSAIAYREKQEEEASYRVWRDGTVHRLTNDMEAARKAGFRCITDPGVDAKGKAKEPKMPAVSAVETYMRTLPEYGEHQRKLMQTEEAWATIHSTLEAAKQRTWVISTFAETGAVSEQDKSGTVLGAFGDNSNDSDILGVAGIDSNEGNGTAGRRPPPPPIVRR